MSLDPRAVLGEHIERRRTARSLAMQGADLQGAGLEGLRADALDLEGADLSGASLRGARFTSCSLRGAKLEGADLSEAALRMCALDDAAAPRASFTKARLENGSARGARLDYADLRGATLTDSDFARASLCGANLERVLASGINLRGADLRGANLAGADLTDADLRGADLTEANLAGAQLHGADLRGASGFADPADSDESENEGGIPSAWQPLAATMTPIVTELLRTAGRRGALDAATAATMVESLEASAPMSGLPPETLAAVTRVVGELGANTLPALIAALQQRDGEPPAQIKELIQRLGQALGVSQGGTADDILARMTGRRPG